MKEHFESKYSICMCNSLNYCMSCGDTTTVRRLQTLCTYVQCVNNVGISVHFADVVIAKFQKHAYVHYVLNDDGEMYRGVLHLISHDTQVGNALLHQQIIITIKSTKNKTKPFGDLKMYIRFFIY